jgi:2-hydroxychromene-2-carboxylate isomerase
MNKQLDFYFDFGSPTAYLAHKRLQTLQQKYNLSVTYKPVLLGGIFKATGNNSPVAIPAKGNYMLQYDLPRFVERYQVEMRFNSHFPINTLTLMRGAIAAAELGIADHYTDIIYNGIWAQEKNLGNIEILSSHLNDNDINSDTLLTLAQTPAVKTQLITNTEAAISLGLFGVPTIFLDEAMYFGQDRLDFIEEVLIKAS